MTSLAALLTTSIFISIVVVALMWGSLGFDSDSCYEEPVGSESNWCCPGEELVDGAWVEIVECTAMGPWGEDEENE